MSYILDKTDGPVDKFTIISRAFDLATGDSNKDKVYAKVLNYILNNI